MSNFILHPQVGKYSSESQPMKQKHENVSAQKMYQRSDQSISNSLATNKIIKVASYILECGPPQLGLAIGLLCMPA